MHDMSFRFVMGFLHPYERAKSSGSPPALVIVCKRAVEADNLARAPSAVKDSARQAYGTFLRPVDGVMGSLHNFARAGGLSGGVAAHPWDDSSATDCCS